MKKLVLLFVIMFKLAFASEEFRGSCRDAKLNIANFITASVGQLLTISKLRIAVEMQNAKLEKVIEDCTDVIKVSKRVLGRAKWNSLNDAQQENFLKQYPIYFITVFRDITLQALNGVKTFSFKPNGIENKYDIILEFYDKDKEPIIFTLRIEENDGYLKITDGEFLGVSVVSSQRDMFDRLYSENPNSIKNFNFKQFSKNQ